MTSSKLPTVIFLETKTRQSKLARIFMAIKQNYTQGHKILILTPNTEAAKVIEECLWHFTPEEFIPHCFLDKQDDCQEQILITTLQQNPHKAPILFNLCSNVSPLFADFNRIYELMDHTHPAKLLLSKERLIQYRSLSIDPELR